MRTLFKGMLATFLINEHFFVLLSIIWFTDPENHRTYSAYYLISIITILVIWNFITSYIDRREKNNP